MDTIRVRLGLTRGPTFLISVTIPQAHLLLMSFTYINIISVEIPVSVNEHALVYKVHHVFQVTDILSELKVNTR